PTAATLRRRALRRKSALKAREDGKGPQKTAFHQVTLSPPLPCDDGRPHCVPGGPESLQLRPRSSRSGMAAQRRLRLYTVKGLADGQALLALSDEPDGIAAAEPLRSCLGSLRSSVPIYLVEPAARNEGGQLREHGNHLRVLHIFGHSRDSCIHAFSLDDPRYLPYRSTDRCGNNRRRNAVYFRGECVYLFKNRDHFRSSFGERGARPHSSNQPSDLPP